ncbi:phosphatidylinositol N-acetylglucosaminyltransferase subunit P-like isoform X2 [Xenia sp. Carnegie-2017]|uniref:phosphatidylinositol N-acetylglucosaminyltransferase subunit P-like isoform X2 n=1 Tax=Xenia sp. Carnegie-2017 TaxID=2897299 RepID=UPI001F03DABC|nr:phosphatidylinositol N-acetylglucosaminyltransferase subunit P-like isoform X2 [Xenia sp. Carnegie-2017]
MAEHSPSPTPERAIYGFFLYITTYLVFGLYIMWAFLPDSILNYIGITYLPQRTIVLLYDVGICHMFLHCLEFFQNTSIELNINHNRSIFKKSPL